MIVDQDEERRRAALSLAAPTAWGPEHDPDGDTRQRVLALLRDALAIIDDELDEDVVGAKLSECIERLAVPSRAVRRGDRTGA